MRAVAQGGVMDVLEAMLSGRGVSSPDPELLEWQARVAEEILGASGDEILVLKAPTGCGKTEAYVAPFLYSALQGQWIAPRMYIVMPTHALLRQMRRRIESYVKALRLGGMVSVGEDHGDVAAPTYLYTAVATLTTPDSMVYGYLAKRVLRWPDPRHGGEVGRYTLPAGLLAGSYIVFDEAQLIQDEAFIGPRLMGHVLQALREAGARIVISTATLPSELRRRLCGGACKELPAPPAKCSKTPVNVMLHKDEPMFAPSTSGGGERPCAKAVEIILDDAARERKVVVIVNTVRRAQQLYKALTERAQSYGIAPDDLLLVHSLFTRRDREEKAERIGSARIVVGTQALEAGIDYDFDVLYTELAPPDSLVQRIGRVGRRRSGAKAHIYDVPRSCSRFLVPYSSMQSSEVSEEELHNRMLQAASKIADNPSTIRDVNEVTKILDMFYDARLVRGLEEKGVVLHLVAEEYLAQLTLMSTPPELAVSLKPTAYVELVLHQGGCSSLCSATAGDGFQVFNYAAAAEETVRLSAPLPVEGVEGSTRCGRVVGALKAAGAELLCVRQDCSPTDVVCGGRRASMGGSYDYCRSCAMIVACLPSLSEIYDSEYGLKLYAIEDEGMTRPHQAGTPGAKRGRRRLGR